MTAGGARHAGALTEVRVYDRPRSEIERVFGRWGHAKGSGTDPPAPPGPERRGWDPRWPARPSLGGWPHRPGHAAHGKARASVLGAHARGGRPARRPAPDGDHAAAARRPEGARRPRDLWAGPGCALPQRKRAERRRPIGRSASPLVCPWDESCRQKPCRKASAGGREALAGCHREHSMASGDGSPSVDRICPVR